MVLKGENLAHLFYFEDLAQKADIPYYISCTRCWKDTGVEIINYPAGISPRRRNPEEALK